MSKALGDLSGAFHAMAEKNHKKQSSVAVQEMSDTAKRLSTTIYGGRDSTPDIIKYIRNVATLFRECRVDPTENFDDQKAAEEQARRVANRVALLRVSFCNC